MSESNRKRLETVAIVVGYAMSRLDDRYLRSQGVRTWKAAFDRAAKILAGATTSLKNLRDEFDPFHDNSRRGWWDQPLRPNRQRVMGDLSEVSDDALLESVNRILEGDKPATRVARFACRIPARAHNVAERLFTGRRAENLFFASASRGLGFRGLEFSTVAIPRFWF